MLLAIVAFCVLAYWASDLTELWVALVLAPPVLDYIF